MNWLNQLLRTASAPDDGSSPAAGVPAMRNREELERLRREALAESDLSERERALVALGHGLSQAGMAPEEDDAALVWAAACGQVADKALALAWLDRVGEEGLLAQIAQHARFAELRLAAARRIADPAILEELGRASKGHDKNVYRHCAEVLRGRRMALGRRARAAELEAALRELLAVEPASVSRLIEIEKELEAVLDSSAAPGTGPAREDPSDGADSAEAVFAACRVLQEQANQRVRLEGEQGRRMQALRAQALELAAQLLAAPATDGAAQARWAQRLRECEAAAAELPAWLHAQPGGAKLREAVGQAGGLLAALAEDEERLRAGEQFLAELESQQPAPAIDEAARQRWHALALPHRPAVRHALEQRWAALSRSAAPPAEARAPEPQAASSAGAAPAPRVDVLALRASLADLEAALEEGHLVQADGIVRQLREALGESAPPRGEHARLQRALARHESLHGWAKWSAKQQRGQLISAARELIGGDVEQIAVAVPALREAWKRLNAQGQASKAQWLAFDESLEKAYAPVAALRAQDAQRRTDARARKEALLAQAQESFAALDAQQADLARIDKRREEILARWRSEPHAGFGDERRLRKRLQALLDRIDERLQSARLAELARRRELVAAAEALVADPDLRHATAQIKALQERWRAPAGTARLARRDEQELWKAFRGACDQVFSRRDAQRSEQAARNEERAQARAALLDGLAACLQATDTGQIESALRRFADAWRQGGARAPDPRAAGGDPQERRARDLQRLARQRVEQLRAAAYRERLEQLRALAPSSDGLDSATLEKGRQAREDVLVELELALDLPSPESSAAARRRRQIEQLQDRFKGRSRQRPDAEHLLAQWHGIAAAPDPQQARRLDAIVQRMAARQPGGA